MQLARLPTDGKARRSCLSRNRLIDTLAIHLTHFTAFLADEELRVMELVRARTAYESVEAVHTVYQSVRY